MRLRLPTAGANPARAAQIAYYGDHHGRPYAAVDAGAAGVYLVAEPLPLPIDEEKFRACAYAVDGDVIGCEDQNLGNRGK